VTVLLVAAGAAVGAPLRYVTDRAVQARHDSIFPWGTLAVNLAGCLLLGLLTALPVDTVTMALFGTGFCGALTTYSTFSYEVLRLMQRRAWLLAALNATATLLTGLGAVYCGIVIGRIL